MPVLTHSIRGDSSAPMAKVFRSAIGNHLLVVPFTRIFDVSASSLSDLPPKLIDALAAASAGETPLDELAEPTPQSISLNVSSACNLSCSYCYAGQGSFRGAQSERM